ncbi:hypothetical protein [Natrinema altunense]|uniref:Uncharacterized protein n=1 Tax=Natrinema altunense (strain JCM 12890 / CGMCC 1.3731 / AJ2) TaxID=1227494 RepID=L9ZCZ0_NATA2|nr:hypothetical protein [Natrinema altunense]ELY84269.1 hypothetical protein C485_15834 [Natrinema altunense JCM 12890]
MNEQRLRPVYLLGIAGSAYALWYYLSFDATAYAAVFGLVTVVLVFRLRSLTADD